MEYKFKIKIVDCRKKDLETIGFDKSYINKAAEKHKFKSIKICDLSCAQANIIKQTALSSGTDCAVHRDVITGKVELSDCILSGSVNQLHKISEKLKFQPLKLSILSEQIKNLLSPDKLEPLIVRDIQISWKNRPLIMGILNITPDSFSDGGSYYTKEKAIEHFKTMVQQGADIIDIGGESTRPYSNKISSEEEIQRVLPVIEEIRKFDKNTIISIDTRNSSTALAALKTGIDIINDVSALEWDNNMINVIKDFQCPIILNHSKGTPDIMQNNTAYKDVADTIYDYFQKKIDYLLANNIDKSKIIIDPGIGFGKTTEQNFEIINRLKEFTTLECPILVGHSRKNFLKETINSDDIENLDAATVNVSQKLIENGVNILRIHNVKVHKILLNVIRSFL